MLLLPVVFLGLFSYVVADAACADESGLLACIPQATVCSGNIPASISSCACTNIQTVLNCYSTHCPDQLTDSSIEPLSSESSVVCLGIGSISFPSGALSSAAPTAPPSVAAQTTSLPSSSTGASAAGSSTIPTSAGGATTTATPASVSPASVNPASVSPVASSTSKAAGERGMGNAAPVLGGLFGAGVGLLGWFL